jgi:hypothetical protein
MKQAPGFFAERSLYRTSGNYRARPREQLTGSVLAALVNRSCFDACYNHCNWDCFQLVGSARGECLRECRVIYTACLKSCTVPSCTPSTTCRQDPVTTDPRCQICHRDNCDGTASVWHTC